MKQGNPRTICARFGAKLIQRKHLAAPQNSSIRDFGATSPRGGDGAASAGKGGGAGSVLNSTRQSTMSVDTQPGKGAVVPPVSGAKNNTSDVAAYKSANMKMLKHGKTSADGLGAPDEDIRVGRYSRAFVQAVISLAIGVEMM